MADSSLLGDLRGPNDDGSPVEVLCSLGDDDPSPRVEQSTRFLVTGVDADENKSSLVLCWVQSDGRLCHYYTYDRSMDHDEQTFTGDAFVVFRIDKDASKPQTATELALSKDGANVLCSYRLRHALKSGIHLVRYSVVSESSSCTVTAAPKQDNEYRVEVGLDAKYRRLPCITEPWNVTYKYQCPPIPSSPSWDPQKQTFYVWGDLDFDDYGASHLNITDDKCKAVHPCAMNQIVPQVMIGSCLAANDDDYRPSWKTFDSWVMQAQYFWMDDKNSSRALCGPVIHVEPGDMIYTRIRYDCKSICASIAVMVNEKEHSEKQSEICIPRPFPHDAALFDNWNDFFSKCLESEKKTIPYDLRPGKRLRSSTIGHNNEGPLARPLLNVEYKGRVDLETLKSVCPFIVKEATYPGATPDSWRACLFCPRLGRGERLCDQEKKHSLELNDAVVLDL